VPASAKSGSGNLTPFLIVRGHPYNHQRKPRPTLIPATHHPSKIVPDTILAILA
jgi:hypothetical protein